MVLTIPLDGKKKSVIMQNTLTSAHLGKIVWMLQLLQGEDKKALAHVALTFKSSGTHEGRIVGTLLDRALICYSLFFETKLPANMFDSTMFKSEDIL